MEEHEYATLVRERLADAVTLYQETYNKEVYASVHTGGPKADFQFRLDAPERACLAGMHAVTLGPLLGLAPWRQEVVATMLHLDYLRKKYPGVDLSVSFPRLCPQAGEYEPKHPVDDRTFVRLLCAVRLFMPFIGITLSTRETAAMRDGLLRIAITKISAGVSTAVGGHADEVAGDTQFEISDDRSVSEITASLSAMGLCPVLVDWNTRAMLK